MKGAVLSVVAMTKTDVESGVSSIDSPRGKKAADSRALKLLGCFLGLQVWHSVGSNAIPRPYSITIGLVCNLGILARKGHDAGIR